MIERVWDKKFNVIYKFYPSIYMNFIPNVQLPTMIFIFYLFFYLFFFIYFFYLFFIFYFINYIYDVNILYASNSNLNTSNFDFIS